MFGVDGAGVAWHRWQSAPNSENWSGWEVFGMALSDGPSTMSVTAAANGGLTLFALDPDGRIWVRTQYIGTNGTDGNAALTYRVAYIGTNGSDGGTWSPWLRIDGAITGITAIGNPDRRVELFGVDGDGNLFHRKELVAGTGNWTHWEPEVLPNA